jgi:phosphate transport system protein
MDTIDKTWQALDKLDGELAGQIYEGDEQINEIVRECMEKDLTISVMQSPVATDWRYLMATFKILSDLERIADNCSDISHYVMHLREEREIVVPPSEMKEMYKVMTSMVGDALHIYSHGGEEDIAVIKDKDDIVDAAFSRNMNEITAKMAAQSNHVRQYMYYGLIIKYIERMADHASNIADWIHYRNYNTIKL